MTGGLLHTSIKEARASIRISPDYPSCDMMSSLKLAKKPSPHAFLFNASKPEVAEQGNACLKCSTLKTRLTRGPSDRSNQILAGSISPRIPLFQVAWHGLASSMGGDQKSPTRLARVDMLRHK